MTDVMVEPEEQMAFAVGSATVPRVEVAPPSRTPWPSSFYDVATVRGPSDSGRDPAAFCWIDVCDTTIGTGSQPCGSPAITKATATVLPTQIPAWTCGIDPFAVFAVDRCAPVGRSDAEAEAQATRRLEGGEEAAVFAAVWTPMLAAATSAGTGVNAVHALGLLECCIRARPDQGVIWMDALTATLLGGEHVSMVGGRAYTSL